MEQLVLRDVEMVYSLQQCLYPSTIEGMAAFFSELGNPRYAYAVIFPIVFWLVGPRPGGVVLLASALSEWVNIAMKWMFQGDRPYWWVREHSNLWNSSRQLMQVPITCETGPGMPSGHVMISLAVLLCCCSYVSSGGEGRRGGGGGGGAGWKRLAQCVVFIFSVVIGLTRVLISSHFIHQVILGVLVGVLLYHCISTSTLIQRHLLWTMPTSPAPLLILSLGLLVSGVLLHGFLLALNLDPAFSVPLAQKHCQQLSWVNLNTTPYYSIVRAAGSVLGMSLVPRMGIKAMQNAWAGTESVKTSTFRTGMRLCALAFTGVAIALLGEVNVAVSILGSQLLGFYVMGMIKAALVPLVTILPLAVM